MTRTAQARSAPAAPQLVPTGEPAPPAGAIPPDAIQAGPIPLAELAELAQLHARAQGIDPEVCRRVLADLRDPASEVDDPGDPDGWARAWSDLGDRERAAGRLLSASRHYTLARFPFPGDEARRRAARASVAAFDGWRRRVGGIERLELELPGPAVPGARGRVACWTAGLRSGRPLLVVLGGIVSVKEQWAPFLRAARRLKLAVLVTEMPSVGENELVYGPDSVEFLPRLLDRLGAPVCAPGVHVVGLSFGGHLALAAARHDSRISSVHTVGAPISQVFADPATWAALPRTSTATLAHLTRTAPADTPAALAPLALTPEHLAAVPVPVRYVASRRDEIIPRREWELLVEHAPDVRWVEFDDVHGSPAHLTDTRLWLLRQVLEQTADRRAGLLGLALAARGRCARTGSTATGTPAPGTPAPGTPAPGIPAPGTPAPGIPAPGTPAHGGGSR